MISKQYISQVEINWNMRLLAFLALAIVATYATDVEVSPVLWLLYYESKSTQQEHNVVLTLIHRPCSVVTL